VSSFRKRPLQSACHDIRSLVLPYSAPLKRQAQSSNNPPPPRFGNAFGRNSLSDPELLEPVSKLVSRDPQQLGGPCLVLARSRHGAQDHLPFYLLEWNNALGQTSP